MRFNVFGKKKKVNLAATSSSTINTASISGSGYSSVGTMNITSVSSGGSGGISYGGLTNSNMAFTNNAILYYPTASLPNSNTALTIQGENGDTVLTIMNDGNIIINGSVSKAAKSFQKAFVFNIDKEATGNKALIKSYKKAIERCLRQIKQMSKDEFIIMLENELERRTEKEMLTYLKESLEEIE